MKTKDLVLRAQNGDRQAINELFCLSYRKPYTVAVLITDSEEDAKAMMQDAYRKAFSSLELLSDKDGFELWFNRFLSCRCRDYLRSRIGAAFSVDLPCDPTVTAFAEDTAAFIPQTGVDYDGDRRRVKEKLSALDGVKKLLLLMELLLGMSSKEIAETLALGGTVERLLREGREELTAFIGDTLENVPDGQQIPFVQWTLLKAAEAAPVHEMDDALLTAKPAQPFQPVSPQEYLQPVQRQTTPQPTEKPKRHIGRTVAVIAAAVALLGAGVFAFIVFALPAITGEQNALSEMVIGEKVVNTPEQVVREFETAFNNNDRDGMAKCFLPDQSMERNLQGGGLQLLNGLIGYFNEGASLQIRCTLENLTKKEDTATGELTMKAEVPFLGEQTLTRPILFEKQEHKWYIKEIQ